MIMNNDKLKDPTLSYIGMLLHDRIKDVVTNEEFHNIRTDPRVAVIDSEYARLMKSEKPHDVLGIPRNATYGEAHGAYRKIMKKIHPDAVPSDLKGSVNELAQKVNAAFASYEAEHRANPRY